MQETIAFIGAGNMSTSLISGLIADGYDPNHIWATNPSREKLDNLQQRFSIQITQDNHQAVTAANIVLLAVKPKQLHTVVNDLALALRSKLVLSVAAGIKTTQIQLWLRNNHAAIVRCMPNTPTLIRAGVTGLYAVDEVTPAQKKRAESIMKAVGAVMWVEKEEQIDVVGALSGSGPAYFFKVMEALQAGAEKLGLSSEQANMLILHTALGSAKMAMESTESISTLRTQVTSKGGMTEKAISVLEVAGIDQLFYDALRAGKQRALEMAIEYST